MLDFLKIAVRTVKKDEMVIYPKFVVGKPTDLMIRGGDFYAVWIEELGLWSTNELDALRLIDRELREYKDSNPEYADYSVAYMWDADSGSIDRWHKYCQLQMRDSFHNLDETLIFSNHVTTKEDYASKRLNYPLEKGELPAFKRLISTLYSEEERRKIEWAIGAIVSGDSKKIQKFLVFYGAAGTGKSTILNIIQMLFDGYYSVFDAQALGSRSSQFALEPFRTNPLVAIQHDGDLSRIEDNTRLNSLISHEEMTVNEKYKATYYNSFKCFLFMGTNKPVKITDAKSGILRRLIDVTPSGNKLDPVEYKTIMRQITFELGAIAYHCLEVYMNDPGRYDDYTPVLMLDATNDFYNFIVDSYQVIAKEDGISLKAAWTMYGEYCEDTKVPYPFSQRTFKEELKNYFKEYYENYTLNDGTRARNYYRRFKVDKLGMLVTDKPKKVEKPNLIQFEEQESILDKELADYPAQYATTNGTPYKAWDKVTTKLSDLDTHKLHYLRAPENHIFIDFDLRDETGEKSLEKNIEAASKWPATYGELSKSGKGVHLHYIYNGDVSMLSHIYDDQIEVKTCVGKSPIRRMLTKCNNLPIATISSGLPLKGDDKLINFEGLKNERALRTVIKRNLNKEYHANTTPSVEFIYQALEDAYNSGMHYDVSDMYNDIFAFAASASNQAEKCMKLVDQMKFKSEDPSLPDIDDEALLVFYDVEVFPNLFLVNYKAAGEGKSVVRMINPSSAEIEQLLRYNLVGFNCRDYDNHILYGRLMGYNNAQLFDLSQRIINKDKAISTAAKFGEAYNISYTDVYDFSTDKKSLKKWEIELGIHHKELGLPWDQPVPKERWVEVAEYCDNDVIATEILFYHLEADWTARQILAKLSGLTVNDKTNSHSGRFIFGNNRNPQSQFNWRNMGAISDEDIVPSGYDDGYTRFTKDGKPVFPGYKYSFGKSIYRGEEVGEGGYVYAEPGMYGNVALLDIASMHPSSAIAEVLFGPEFTRRFEEIKDARVAIKHKDFDKAKTMLNGALAEFLTDPNMAKALANALKIVINSVYGLTAASFPNLFKDPRNVDNIVAKRGALFMVNLKHEVQKRGFKVIHIKTDSIKIADATPEIIDFVMNYGKMYGYTFEHEATYDRICLVNDAVYIAQYSEPLIDKDTGKEIWWTATGAQFKVPYTFKKLFSKEEIEFKDLCENKSVQTALYLDINESLPDVSAYEKELKKRIAGKAKKPTPEFVGVTDEELEAKIAEGHVYKFVGKVGNFCPIKPGRGGGILLRQTNTGGFASATGADGYRWLESEIVQGENEKDIDYSYFNKLVDDAIDKISEFGDYEWFVSGDPYIGPEYDLNGRPIYGAIELFKDELDECLVEF